MRLSPSWAPQIIAAVSLCALLAGPPAVAQPPQSYPPQQSYPEPQQYPPQDPQQQQYPQQQDENDPDAANHGVARISVMDGDVSVRRGDNGDFVAAALNAPLVVGDRVLTGPNGRAEVQFDSANMIRIAPNSEIRLSELVYGRYQVQIARGLATFSVVRPSSADVEVSTPLASIRPKRQGDYRVVVGMDGQTEITARSGEIEVFTPRGAEPLYPGKTMQLRGTASDPEYQIVNAYPGDDWDRWNSDRDRALVSSASSRYVAPDIYGADDLDHYGRWVSDPAYGNVWAPQVAPGWAPYRAGRWVWIDYYGWTWVSSDPWGWAPYHYGRWYQSPRFGWCWYPGVYGYGGRHFWSPALVGFVGFGGGGFGVGFGFGSVGWVPLAPHERYHPWYGRGFYGGGRNVNIANNVNIYNTYRNARVQNAVTAVDRNGFANGGAGRAFTGDLRQASLVHGQLPIQATRQSMHLGANTSVNPDSIARVSGNNHFYSTRQNGAGGLGQQAQRNQGNWRQFGAPTAPRVQGSGFGSGGWQGRVSPPQQQQQQQQQQKPGNAGGGWGRFGNPGRPAQPQQPRQAPQSQAPQINGGGWQRPQGFQNSNSVPRSGGFGNQSGYSRPAPADRSNGYRSAPQSVRMSPPMVRERSAPAPRSNGGGGNGGGGSHGGGGGSHGGGNGGHGHR